MTGVVAAVSRSLRYTLIKGNEASNPAGGAVPI